MPRQFCLKDAKFALLTYPQVPEPEANGFADLATELFSSERVAARWVIGRELHADGGIHFHCFLDFGRKFSSRDTRIFDLGGRHPNIERVGRTPRKAYDYAIKDNDVVSRHPDDYAGPDDQSAGGGGEQREPSADWVRIVSAETRDEFFRLVGELQPRSLVCSYVNIARYADWRYRPTPTPYQHPEDWTFNLESYPVLLDWVDESLRGSPERLEIPFLCSLCLQRIFRAARPPLKGDRSPAAARFEAYGGWWVFAY